jgi:hypothetical protein
LNATGLFSLPPYGVRGERSSLSRSGWGVHDSQRLARSFDAQSGKLIGQTSISSNGIITDICARRATQDHKPSSFRKPCNGCPKSILPVSVMDSGLALSTRAGRKSNLINHSSKPDTRNLPELAFGDPLFHLKVTQFLINHPLEAKNLPHDFLASKRFSGSTSIR